MSTEIPSSFFAVDIGNSRIKIGWFEIGCGAGLPAPVSTLNLTPSELGDDHQITTWLSSLSTPHDPLRTDCGLRIADCGTRPKVPWHIASVNRLLTERLRQVLLPIQVGPFLELSHADLPLDVHVDTPEKVGIDRLLAAVAVNHVRRPHRPAVVVDLGTAITVDLISPDGGFEGGAILPGIAMAARAMTEQTDALPQSPLVELHHPPPAVGKSTLTAIESGLFWGAIGAIRELVAQYGDMQNMAVRNGPMGNAIMPSHPARPLPNRRRRPQIAERLARDGQQARHMPHLVLAGVALVVQ